MKKVEMAKAELAIVKSLIKFTSKDRDRCSHIIYNGKRKRFEATDGWAAVIVEYPIAGVDEEKYVVELTSEAVILDGDANWFPVIDRVIPNATVRSKEMSWVDGFGLGKKSKRNDKAISAFLGRIDLCLNFRYLLNLPKTDYEFYQHSKNPKKYAGLFVGEIELCGIQAAIMPINTDNN